MRKTRNFRSVINYFAASVLVLLISCNLENSQKKIKFFADYDPYKRKGINEMDYNQAHRTKGKYVTLTYNKNKLDTITVFNSSDDKLGKDFKVTENAHISIYEMSDNNVAFGKEKNYFAFSPEKAIRYTFSNNKPHDGLILCHVIVTTKYNCIGRGEYVKQGDTMQIQNTLLENKEIPVQRYTYKVQYDNRLTNKFTFLSWFTLYHGKFVEENGTNIK